MLTARVRCYYSRLTIDLMGHEIKTLFALVAVLLALPFMVSPLHAQRADTSQAELQPYGPPPAIVDYRGGELLPNQVYRVAANPEHGFYWPFFFALPNELGEAPHILVNPNNDGYVGVSTSAREYFASIFNEQLLIDFGQPLGSIVLSPAFPRPALESLDDNLYLHALTRASLLTSEPELARVDVQLLNMVDHLRGLMVQQAINAQPEVLLWGFSAAGDFVSRFAMLHPKRVAAVAAGGMGGLPMLPIDSYKNEPLTYPVGTADFEEITGTPFDAESYKALPVLYLQGGNDVNDSVVSGAANIPTEEFGSDSYSRDQAILINESLGEEPINRVPTVVEIFTEFGMENFRYQIIPEIEHEDRPLKPIVRDFFKNVVSEEP